MVKFKTVIKGISPLVQSNCNAMMHTPPPSPEKVPAWLEVQTYRGEDGYLYHPAGAIRNAFFEGAGQCNFKINKKSAKTALRGIISIFPEEFVLIHTGNEPAKEYQQLTASAVNKSTKGRIITFRPLLKEWEMRFVTEVNNDFFDINKKTTDQLMEAYRQAGMKVGIGCWRPEKSGLYGRFELKEFTQI